MFPIFEKLGGDDATLEALKKDAIRETWPTRETLKVWKKKGLPGTVIKRLMSMCDGRGISYCARDFEYLTENKLGGAVDAPFLPEPAE